MWEKLAGIEIVGLWATAQVGLISLALVFGLWVLSKIEIKEKEGNK